MFLYLRNTRQLHLCHLTCVRLEITERGCFVTPPYFAVTLINRCILSRFAQPNGKHFYCK